MKLAFFNEIEKARTVLIVGAGGGFDIFSGLPLYFSLLNAGKTVHLANLSFSKLDFSDAERPVPALCRVTAATSGPTNYFPEVYLSQWLSKRFGETPVYAIHQEGARRVQEAYDWLVQTLRPDTLILADGGTDSLMRGDEASLGTPEEDMASLSAAHLVQGPERKLLVCLGFGIDFFHGICHAHFLENVSALIADGGYLGTWSVTREMQEFALYEEACSFVSSRMPRQPSIVNSSIISAINGNFGDFHATKRTEGSTLFINPLMGLYWSFKLESVARRNLYLDRIRDTITYSELSLAIEQFRTSQQKTRLWKDIPC